jgi:hypothetical protein
MPYLHSETSASLPNPHLLLIILISYFVPNFPQPVLFVTCHSASSAHGSAELHHHHQLSIFRASMPVKIHHFWLPFLPSYSWHFFISDAWVYVSFTTNNPGYTSFHHKLCIKNYYYSLLLRIEKDPELGSMWSNMITVHLCFSMFAVVVAVGWVVVSMRIYSSSLVDLCVILMYSPGFLSGFHPLVLVFAIITLAVTPSCSYTLYSSSLLRYFFSSVLED